MSMPGRAPLRAFARRRTPRCPLAVPVRVTVLRSGTAYSIPGRSVDLAESGIAVVLAGEVRVTDVVGVEFLLPDLGLGLQTKAIVRHHSALRCGLEFTELTRHQQAVIREWARQKLQAKPPGKAVNTTNSAGAAQTTSSPVSRGSLGDLGSHRFLLLAIGLVLLTGLLAWWHWQSGWKEIEQQIPNPTGRMTKSAPGYFVAASQMSHQLRKTV